MTGVYAKFYHKGALSGNPIPACGTDSVCYMDNRWNQARMINFAKLTMDLRNKHLGKGFIGFTLCRGSQTLTPLVK